MPTEYNYGTGRRKTAAARVFIKPGRPSGATSYQVGKTARIGGDDSKSLHRVTRCPDSCRSDRAGRL